MNGLKSKNLKIYIMRRLIILILICTTFNLTAQERKRDRNAQEGNEKMHMMKDLTPEEAATLRTKKMTLHLNMSEAQQKEVYALNLKNARDRQAKRAEREKKKEGEKAEKPSKEERLKLMNEKLDHQIANKRELERILNKEQFEKWERSNHRKDNQKGRKQRNKKHRSKRSR